MCPAFERPNIRVIQTAVKCSRPDTNVQRRRRSQACPAAPCSRACAHLPRARRGAIAGSLQSMAAGWEPPGARREREGRALPSASQGSPPRPVDRDLWWGGLTYEARAAGGKGLHGTSFPLWDCSPGRPVGSMENASAYQHSMPVRPSSSFKFP